MDKAESTAPEVRTGRADAAAGKPDQFTTDELFRGTSEIVIAHRDALYRLKITRQGKLVLNK